MEEFEGNEVGGWKEFLFRLLLRTLPKIVPHVLNRSRWASRKQLRICNGCENCKDCKS
jgi:hypothetical protein